MKYFPQEIRTEEELKEVFRTLSKKLHPDMGGDNEEFIAMKAEYDYLIKTFDYGFDDDSNKDLIDELMDFMKSHDFKKGWVYYTFVSMAKNVTKSDFDYMCEQLEYKSGWAWHKWNEYNESMA